MQRCRAYLIAMALLSACGGGGGGGGASQGTTAVSSGGSSPALPNAHGLYADANGVFPTDADAGIFPNQNGLARSFSTAGKIDTSGPFFKSFGNGRTCASCHRQEDGFSVTPGTLQRLFNSTAGADPVFQLLDGANSPQSPVNTLTEKRTAYSMLLNKGLFRIGLAIPPSAEFELAQADDPYAFASAGELSLFRRPLPSANLRFLADVMWDSRETAKRSSSGNCAAGVCYAPIDFDLGRQANTATRGHAQAQADLTTRDQGAIVAFEKTLFVAQQVDNAAGLLFPDDLTGGALALSQKNFSFGVNDLFKGSLDQQSFRLFDTWINFSNSSNTKLVAARKAIALGQSIFNNKQFTVTGVPGLERVVASGPFVITCSLCHSTPDVGNLSEPQSFNIGTANAEFRTLDMPLYTLRNKSTGETIQTTDPGLAMTTGLWQDVGRFKVPVLRGLSARAPYFHNGSAKTIEDVTAFYDRRFNIGFTPKELAALNAFLKAL